MTDSKDSAQGDKPKSFLFQDAPELEFGNTYQGKIVELQPSGALVQIHVAMPPVFIKNSQLDVKKVSLPFRLFQHVLLSLLFYLGLRS